MTAIGNAFTHLKPAIQFTSQEIQNHSVTACVLEEPPSRLAGVHSPGLINAWYTKLKQCVSQPVQVEPHRSQRRVQVLGTAIFDFVWDGTLKCYVWDFDQADKLFLAELPEHQVVVLGSPFDALWMDRIKQGALQALLKLHPSQHASWRAYVDWADSRLKTLCWTPKAQEAVRYQVAVELDLKVDMLELASKIQLSAQPRLPLRADVYNNCVRYRKDYFVLLAEAPQLIPLYALMSEELSYCDTGKPQELTARMRDLLLWRGQTPAIWRLIHREGTAWMSEHLAYFNFDLQSTGSIASDLLDMAMAFGTTRLVPPWLLNSFLQIGGHPDQPGNDYSQKLNDLFPLCARLGHLLAQADEATLNLLQERANDIFNWACGHLVDVPKRTLRHASVEWLVRQVDLQRLKESLLHQAGKPWYVPYHLNMDEIGLNAVILDSPMAVWQEGQTMHHCAGKLVKPCARGELLMVSLRCEFETKPLATVAYDMTGHQVSLKYISGFANQLVSPGIRELAEDCCSLLQKQRIAHQAEVNRLESMKRAA